MSNVPKDIAPPPNAKHMVLPLMGLFLWLCTVLGCWWAMLTRKVGTVGTRFYFMPMMWSTAMFVALYSNDFYPDKYFFQVTLVLMWLFYLQHLYMTMKNRVHVHTRCVGLHNHPALEVAMLILLCWFAYEFQAFAYVYFTMASCVADTIHGELIKERDRQRSVQMADAMWEQQYMMDNYREFQETRR